MSEFVTVGKVATLRAPTQGTCVEVNGKRVAIWNFEGTFYAIDDTCPHRGGSLSEGYLDSDGAVACPLHGWMFDVRTGQNTMNASQVACYEIRVVDGDLQVKA